MPRSVWFVLPLRKGEAVGLAWKAVNFEQGVIVPDHQRQRVCRSLLCCTYCATRDFSWLHADPYREFEGPAQGPPRRPAIRDAV
jgi:hypothetical protein